MNAKLEDWTQKELSRNLDKLIIDVDQGWLAFGHYHIKPMGDTCRVYTYNNDCLGEFSTKRSAISWCVADKNKRLNLANYIKVLDNQKMRYEADIACRRQMVAKSRSNEFRDIIETKMQARLKAMNGIKAELEKCISLAKYIQIRGFLNETARTSRS